MTTKYKPISYYLNLPWTFETLRSDDKIEPWTTRVKELSGCMSHGKTPEKSLTHIKDAIKSYILATMEIEEEIPEPLAVENFKGTITYRTKPEIHYKVALIAKSRGISINRVIDNAVNHEINIKLY